MRFKCVSQIPSRGTRAVGVEYINGAGGQAAVAKASRLVVLSAGAFGSPTILQRSIISD
jgi:alcohol oxidase